MTDSETQDTIEIEVTDFGPIAKARVDLRPLTVFVGPSNTGKSYLAILVYALHRYFSGSTWPPGRLYISGRRVLSRGLSRKANRTLIESVEQFMSTSLENEEFQKTKRIPLPEQLVQTLREAISSLGPDIGNEILRCYGIESLGALVRKGKGTLSHVTLKTRDFSDMAAVESKLTIGEDKLKLEAILPDQIVLSINPESEDPLSDYMHAIRVDRESMVSDEKEEYLRYLAQQVIDMLSDYTLPYVVGPIRRPAFYLPADRTGVMHAHSVVVSALIGNAPMAGLRPTVRTPMLSGVLADFLEQLIGLDQPRYRRRGRRTDLGSSIEDAILGGDVRLEKSEGSGYPRFSYQPAGWKTSLSLMNASSMVSELAPVVLYLRHMVEPGNVLIVEEPESHLHPAMQVEFTRQLAALVRAGIRIIVTTHSEWLLEELANIVRRSAVPEHNRASLAERDVALTQEEVGAWLFRPMKKPRGSVVKEIRLDESGLYPSGFDDVAATLHNDWAEISSRIGEDA